MLCNKKGIDTFHRFLSFQFWVLCLRYLFFLTNFLVYLNVKAFRNYKVMNSDDKNKLYLLYRTLWSESSTLRPVLVWHQIFPQKVRKLNLLSNEMFFMQIGWEIKKLKPFKVGQKYPCFNWVHFVMKKCILFINGVLLNFLLKF